MNGTGQSVGESRQGQKREGIMNGTGQDCRREQTGREERGE
jgi:hypothetical protein